MWNLHPLTLLEIGVRTVIVYAVLLTGVRLTGKRQIGQLTPFDLVVLLLISNAVQNAMTGPDTSVTGGVVAACTLLALNLIISLVRLRSDRFRRFVEGVPLPLVVHGQIQFRNLKHEQMATDELMATLREHEAQSVDQVELAMLEIDGTVSVIRRDTMDPQRLTHSRKRLTHHHRRSD
jgi:uncharacterized membrane protein YcaP (DUF421 family)